MGLQLMLDGKPLGEFDGKQLTTPGGDQHAVNQPDAETITVPLHNPVQDRVDQRSARHTPTAASDAAEVLETQEETKESIDTSKLEIKILNKQVEALMQQIKATNPGAIRTNDRGDTEIEIKDLINVKDDEDPHGIARTLQQAIKGINALNEKVTRVDQHFNFQEFKKHVDSAKEDYKEFFNDENIGPLAERMLDSALRTDSNNPVPVIVANVIKDIKAAGFDPQVGKVKKDLENKKKIPPTIRTGDGSPASITVNKPKSLDDAKKQYKAWREARQAAAVQGR